MYANMDNYSQINLRKIVSDLKKLLDNIIERLSFNNHKSISIEELIQLYSKDKDFLNDLQYIKDSLGNIALKLESSDIFSQEYVDFLSIKMMSDYIVDDIKLFIQYSTFIDSLLLNFSKLINSKVNNDKSDYQRIYADFQFFLDENERFFYLKIYKSINEYDGLIDEITNILW